jgi:pyruvate dehydrogenase E1 component alpha subunit
MDRSVNFVGSTPILGSIVPLACGAAFEQRYNRKSSITVVFLGDGAFEEGAVYETFNLAALFKLPLLFVVENNLFAVNSKLRDRRSDAYDVEKIVTGFGINYVKADGNDYQDVFGKAKSLVGDARKGKPAVFECMTYRHMAHSAPVFEEGYREEDVAEKRQEKDPVRRMRQALLDGGAPEKEIAAIEEEVEKIVAEDIAFALRSPYPKKGSLYTDLYVL